MKRSAAIIGPTPSFLRWAIRRPCVLREIDPENLADSTFRQLRSLKELSNAYLENRVLEGVAFHQDTSKDKQLVGFIVDEIESAYGGREVIEGACSTCPANIDHFAKENLTGETVRDAEVENLWAGCHGLLYVNDGLIELVEKASSEFNLLDCFQSTQPIWFGLWIDRVLKGEALKLLGSLFPTIKAVELFNKSELEPKWSQAWTHFSNAIEECCKNDLELHVELFPEGESDGSVWKLRPHCLACKSTLLKDESCQTCGVKMANAKNQKKRKVLGIRPYMKMEYVLGAQESQNRLNAYLDQKSKKST